jgi:predicted HTH domain antitoxin
MKDLPLERVTREALVLDLFRRAAISSGKAAELLGLTRIDFIKSAGTLGIASIQMSADELAAEVSAAKRL